MLVTACRMAIVMSVFLVAASTAAQSRKDSAVDVAIERAQRVRVSSFDPALPNLTLKSFLDYETDHAQINWTVTPCTGSEDEGNAICVRADSAINDQISAFVTVQVSGISTLLPKLVSVEVIDHGLVHWIRLIEFPVAIRRRWRSRTIRDVPPVLSTAG